MTISKELLKKLRGDIDAALVQVGKANGVAIKTGNARYDTSAATFKLEITSLASDGTAVNKPRVDFQQNANLFGLEPEWLDKTFRAHDGNAYRITGLVLTRRKFPVQCERVTNGRVYKFTEYQIREAMGVAKPLFANVPVVPPVVRGPRNPLHNKIVMLLNVLRANNPESYYADGEHRAAGRSEKQIYDLNYDHIARTLSQ